MGNCFESEEDAQRRAEEERAAQLRATQRRAEEERAAQLRATQRRAEEERAAQLRATQRRVEDNRAAQLIAAQRRVEEQAARLRATQRRAEEDPAAQLRAKEGRAAQLRAAQLRVEDIYIDDDEDDEDDDEDESDDEDDEEEGAAQFRAWNSLQENIDFYIRTRKNFDSRDPLAYSCALSSIKDDTDVENSWQELLQFQNIRLEEFVEKEFVCSTSNSQIFVRVKHLTPFQGDDRHRVFGYFKCGECKNTWMSGLTWRNKWQKCKSCLSKCYPYQQNLLKRKKDDDDDDNRKPHHVDKCQKCQELGRICAPSLYYSV